MGRTCQLRFLPLRIAVAPTLWAYRGTRSQAPATVDAEGASRE